MERRENDLHLLATGTVRLSYHDICDPFLKPINSMNVSYQHSPKSRRRPSNKFFLLIIFIIKNLIKKQKHKNFSSLINL